MHSLALVVRKARDGHYWYYSKWPNQGQLRYSRTPMMAMFKEQAIVRHKTLAILDDIDPIERIS